MSTPSPPASGDGDLLLVAELRAFVPSFGRAAPPLRGRPVAVG
ncbi:hypothetical protein OG618_03935 [Kitasatospora sp. NBC_01246]|nr:hypothetical protein [Kitasatospora sp. NBC_01246]